MWKKHKVVMLPTNAKANLFINNVNGKLLFDNDSTLHRVLPNGIYQHIYITSNEKIKEGDWKYDTKLNIVIQHGSYTDGCKKIIATTDTSLGLPKPSQQYIEHYVAEYNKGNIITKVLVEYEEATEYDKVYNKEKYFPRLKLNPDNTINISLIKDNWNKKEVSNLLIKAMGDAVKNDRIPNHISIAEFSINWIDKNL